MPPAGNSTQTKQRGDELRLGNRVPNLQVCMSETKREIFFYFICPDVDECLFRPNMRTACRLSCGNLPLLDLGMNSYSLGH